MLQMFSPAGLTAVGRAGGCSRSGLSLKCFFVRVLHSSATFFPAPSPNNDPTLHRRQIMPTFGHKHFSATPPASASGANLLPPRPSGSSRSLRRPAADARSIGGVCGGTGGLKGFVGTA